VVDKTYAETGGIQKNFRDMGNNTYAEVVSTAPSADQDPIFDHANGTKIASPRQQPY
jgi:hypothetical protein